MAENAYETVADIRSAISEASDEDRERVKAEFREAELGRPAADQRQTVLDATLPTAPDEEPRHTVESLIEGARNYFDQSPHIVAGALSGTRQTFTIDEAAAKIDAFANAEHGSETA